VIRKNRTERDVQSLTGQRGPNETRAVLWGEIDRLAQMIAKRLVTGRFGRAISPYVSGEGITEDEFEKLINESNSVFTINQLIDNTNTYIDNTIIDVRAELGQEILDRAGADTIIESSVTSLTTRVGDNEAGLEDEVILRTNADSAIASDLSTLTTNFGAVSATVSTQASAISTLEGFTAATYAVRVKGGDAEATLEFVAADDPIDGAASAIRFVADDVLIDATITSNLIFAQAIKSEHIEIDGTLRMDANSSALLMSKNSISDPTDGAYFGRTLGVSGVGFGLALSRDDGGRVQSFSMSKDGGFKIRNADFLIGAGTRASNTVSTNDTVLLDTDATSLSLDIIASGNTRNTSGGATTVELYDGLTLIESWVSSGSGNGAPFAPIGLGTPYTVFTVTSRGGEEAPKGYNTTYYPPPGAILSVVDYDISGLVAPSIKVIRAAGGANTGGLHYMVGDNDPNDVLASPISRTSTASGTIVVAGEASGDFPELIPARGLWIIANKPASVTITTPSAIYDSNYSGSLALISEATPVWTKDSAGATSMHYRFFPM